jgi:YidC/Oxa1 family membrane protein insertase
LKGEIPAMTFEPPGTPSLDPQGGPDIKRLIMTVFALTAMWVVYIQYMQVNPPAPQTAEQGAENAAAVKNADSPQDHKAPSTIEDAQATQPEGAQLAQATNAPETLVHHSADVAAALAKAGAVGGAAQVPGGYRATLSSHGAQLASFSLTGYEDTKRLDEKTQKGPPVDLVGGAHEGATLFTLVSRGGDVPLKADAPYELLEKEAGRVAFARNTGTGVQIKRVYDFDDKNYTLNAEIHFTNNADVDKVLEMDLRFTGVERAGERDEGSLFMPLTDVLGAVCRVGGDKEKVTSKELDDGPKTFEGKVAYAGVDRQFFLSAVLPADDVPTNKCNLSGWKKEDAQGLTLAMGHAPLKLAPGEKRVWRYTAFFGPKQLGLLQTVGQQLDENIEFGWFGVISRPLLWVLVKFFDVSGNYGLAIIMLTLLVKLLTFPLTQKQYISMQQMKTLAPELKELQKKFGHDRTLMGQKQMELYQQRGINPMAGCLPMFIQMPIWFALYRTLWNSVELYQQPFYGWLTDLTTPDPFYVLPIAMGVTMFITTLFQPPPSEQPQMKYVMYGMPFFLTFIMLSLPAGLSLYMLTNNVLSIGQQAYIKRRYGTPTDNSGPDQSKNEKG